MTRSSTRAERNWQRLSKFIEGLHFTFEYGEGLLGIAILIAGLVVLAQLACLKLTGQTFLP